MNGTKFPVNPQFPIGEAQYGKSVPHGSVGSIPERFCLVLQALPSHQDVPPVLRLRRGLKYLLRVCRLRCVRCEPADEVPDHADLEARA